MAAASLIISRGAVLSLASGVGGTGSAWGEGRVEEEGANKPSVAGMSSEQRSVSSAAAIRHIVRNEGLCLPSSRLVNDVSEESPMRRARTTCVMPNCRRRRRIFSTSTRWISS